ncbi:hypothetical protein [Maricaulis sp.]|uniref:hypothetical protein n=1 Tax=Maricaulis sp. TaxID=1486257 RepID=UPI0025C6C142|nr:hypothetical protein [Maricaulis sp.]
MSLKYQSLAPSRRLGLAVTVLTGLGLVVLLPLVLLGAQVAQASLDLADQHGQMDRQAGQLAERHRDLLARQASLEDARDLVGAALDPEDAWQGFAVDIDLLAERLTDAGAVLDATPEMTRATEGELHVLRAGLSGLARYEDLLMALAAPDLAALTITRFDVVALAGAEPVRVRFSVEAVAYLPVPGGDDE